MTTPVQSNDPILSDIQANILKGHGRNFAHHIFLQFIPGQKDLALAWIAAFAGNSVTSTKQQLERTALFRDGYTTDGGSILLTGSASPSFFRATSTASLLQTSGMTRRISISCW